MEDAAEVVEEDARVVLKMTTATPMSRFSKNWVSAQRRSECTSSSCSIRSSLSAGQNANAGMLPPSDSDDESDDELVAAKGKSAQVSLIRRNYLRAPHCSVLQELFMPSRQATNTHFKENMFVTVM